MTPCLTPSGQPVAQVTTLRIATAWEAGRATSGSAAGRTKHSPPLLLYYDHHRTRPAGVVNAATCDRQLQLVLTRSPLTALNTVAEAEAIGCIACIPQAQCTAWSRVR